MSTVLIAGVSGIVGLNTANHFLANGWSVVGVSRKKSSFLPKEILHLAVDLQNEQDCSKKLANLTNITHVVYATWSKQNSEEENCKVNGAMLENLLDTLLKHNKLQHVVLVTGTKHYLGPFSSYGKQEPVTPFQEDQPRLPVTNFYYVLEDILFDRAKKYNFNWNVPRPHSIIGYAPGNQMNLGTCLAVYAILCKELKLAFIFPGSAQQYHGLVDVSDASLVGHHIYWEVIESSPNVKNEAYNVTNGDIFRWKYMWKDVAKYFGLEDGPYPGHETPLQATFANEKYEKEWEKITQKYNLQKFKLSEVAPFWHADADLGRKFECVNSMTKSRKRGFNNYLDSKESLFNLFDTLKTEKIIPDGPHNKP